MSLELEKRLGKIFLFLGIVTGLVGAGLFIVLVPKVYGPFSDSESLIASLTLMIFVLVGSIIAITGGILYWDWKVQMLKLEREGSL